MAIVDFIKDGRFEPQKVAAILSTSPEDVAMAAGLHKDVLQNRTELWSGESQRRLREMAEVLNKVTPRFGSPLLAYAWYRSEPLPGFAGLTAMSLVQADKAQEVLNYLDEADLGIHA